MFWIVVCFLCVFPSSFSFDSHFNARSISLYLSLSFLFCAFRFVCVCFFLFISVYALYVLLYLFAYYVMVGFQLIAFFYHHIDPDVFFQPRSFQCNESSFLFNREQIVVLLLFFLSQFCSSNRFLLHSLTHITSLLLLVFFFILLYSSHSLSADHLFTSISIHSITTKIQFQSNCVRFTFPRHHFVCYYSDIYLKYV